MQQINNGYDSRYYLLEDGRVYNKTSDKYIKESKGHYYTLKKESGEYKKVSLKELYLLVYGEIWCIDDVVDLDGEKWLEIENTQGRYYVSNMGRVKSKVGYKSIILKEYITKKGYPKVTIVQNGKRVCRMVGSLVMSAYALLPCDTLSNYEIHHINRNKRDNRLENLEYLTREEHIKKHKEIREKEKQYGSTKPKDNIYQ